MERTTTQEWDTYWDCHLLLVIIQLLIISYVNFTIMLGLGLGPFMEYAILVDPSIIPTAFLSTCVIFGCFSLSAMFSDQRRWLYLGGTLFSLMSMLLLMSVVNLFIGSKFLYQVFIFMLIEKFC